MPELTEQFLIKVSPEMSERIEKKYSEYLKLGTHITKSEFIRCLLNEALTAGEEMTYDEICLLGDLSRTAQSRHYQTWKRPFSGWHHVFDQLHKKGWAVEREGAYVISEEGEKIWEALPFDQKKRLRVPQPK